MIIEVREPAIQQIEKLQLQENQGICIETEQERSCTLFVDYQLVVKTITDSDKIIEVEGVRFIIPKHTEKLLPEKVYLTYSNESAFKLFSNEEILKTQLSIQFK